MVIRHFINMKKERDNKGGVNLYYCNWYLYEND